MELRFQRTQLCLLLTSLLFIHPYAQWIGYAIWRDIFFSVCTLCKRYFLVMKKTGFYPYSLEWTVHRHSFVYLSASEESKLCAPGSDIHWLIQSSWELPAGHVSGSSRDLGLAYKEGTIQKEEAIFLAHPSCSYHCKETSSVQRLAESTRTSPLGGATKAPFKHHAINSHKLLWCFSGKYCTYLGQLCTMPWFQLCLWLGQGSVWSLKTKITI